MRLLWLCLALALLCGGIAPARAEAGLAVAVWLQGRDDAALKTRIEGQTADLEVTLVPIAREGRLLSARERLTAAGGLLQETGARALIYWEAGRRGGRRLRVLSGARVFSRELGDEAAEDPVRSATLESAALVVRTVLRNLLAGEDTGISLSEALGESEAEAEPRPAPAPRPPSPRRLDLVLSLGWQVAVDGQSPPGQHALSLSFGLTVSRLLVRLWVLGGVPAALGDGNVSLSLSRHGFALGLLGEAVRKERLRVLGGALAGLCGYYRTTNAVSADYEATAPSFVSALCLTAQLELWLRPSRRVPLYLEALAGAEAVAGRPRLGYADAGAFVPFGELWPVQPVLGLSLVYVWERPPATPAGSERG